METSQSLLVIARMGQNFDEAKRDNTFWPMLNILKGSVSVKLSNFVTMYAKFIALCAFDITDQFWLV